MDAEYIIAAPPLRKLVSKTIVHMRKREQKPLSYWLLHCGARHGKHPKQCVITIRKHLIKSHKFTICEEANTILTCLIQNICSKLTSFFFINSLFLFKHHKLEGSIRSDGFEATYFKSIIINSLNLFG